MQLFSRDPQVGIRFLLRIKFLLLFRGEQRTNLRKRVAHDRAGLGGRVFVDRLDLRTCLAEDWLNLRLLLGRQVQRLDQMLKAGVMAARPASGERDSCAPYRPGR